MSLKDFVEMGKLGKSSESAIANLIGSGAYSTVTKVKRKDDGKIYALKKVSSTPLLLFSNQAVWPWIGLSD